MKYYRRVETIKEIIVTDYMKLDGSEFSRNGPGKNESKSMTVQWFREGGEELSESSVTYNVLETAFQNLPEED